MKYSITGADAQTARETRFEVEAASEADALKEARRRGVFVSSISAIPTGMSGGKLFLIVSGGVAFGIVIAFLAYVGFFSALIAAIGPTAEQSRGIVEPAAEDLLISAIKEHDVDGAKRALLQKPNFQRIGDAALVCLISEDRLRDYGRFESETGRKEREFWTDLAERLVKSGADVNSDLVSARDAASLQFLISHGAGVNTPDYEGNTPLCRLANDWYDDAVAVLISNGANVNTAGHKGNTPLHEAAKTNAVKVINRLLAAGATVNPKNEDGQTPLAIANLAMQREAAALLKSAGGKE